MSDIPLAIRECDMVDAEILAEQGSYDPVNWLRDHHKEIYGKSRKELDEALNAWFERQLQDPKFAMSILERIETAKAEMQTKHVCGLSGFPESGDICPACKSEGRL